MGNNDAAAQQFAALRQHEVRLVDAVKPSGEMDTRAIMVFLFSFALVALCLSNDDKNAISVFGFSIRAGKLEIGIPIVAVLIYWWVELSLAWRLNLDRSRMIFRDIGSGLEVFRELKLEELAEFQNLGERAIAKRREIASSYESKVDELLRRQEELPIEKTFGSPEAIEIDEGIETAQKELEDRIKSDPEIAAQDEWTDRLLDSFDPNMVRLERMLDRIRRSSRIQQIRITLEYAIPTVFLVIAIGVSLLSIFQPDFLLPIGGH